MARKLKLDDLHLIILSTASQRQGGIVLPVADSISADTDRVAAALSELLRHKLLAEAPTTQPPYWREEEDTRFALVLTPVGEAAIGLSEADDAAPDAAPKDVGQASAPRVAANSKSAAIIALMQRESGATLAELVAATGWLPHTTRAALTGLRKKDHVIERTKRGNETCYRITAAAR